MTDIEKEKKPLDLEQMLGLNDHSDRIRISPVESQDTSEVQVENAIDWKTYSIAEEGREAVITEEQANAISDVMRNADPVEQTTRQLAICGLMKILSVDRTYATVKQALMVLETQFDYNSSGESAGLCASCCSLASKVFAELLACVRTSSSELVLAKKDAVRKMILRLSAFLCTVPSVDAELRVAFVAFVTTAFGDIRGCDGSDEETVVGIAALATFLRYKPNRVIAVPLLPLLSALFAACSTNTIQFTYHLLLCIWMLSYLPEALPLFARKQCNLVAQLTSSLNTFSSEKIIRVILSTLQNLLANETLAEELVDHGLLRRLTLLNQKVFKDRDIGDAVKTLLDATNANYAALTSVDLYAKEVESGMLHWGPRHSDDFWKENVRAFEAEDFKWIRALITLLDSADEDTVAVACFDLGAFACYYPNGRKIVAQFHGKDKVMALLSSSSETIVNCALSSCSRLMVENWEDLEKGRK